MAYGQFFSHCRVGNIILKWKLMVSTFLEKIYFLSMTSYDDVITLESLKIVFFGNFRGIMALFWPFMEVNEGWHIRTYWYHMPIIWWRHYHYVIGVKRSKLRLNISKICHFLQFSEINNPIFPTIPSEWWPILIQKNSLTSYKKIDNFLMTS